MSGTVGATPSVTRMPSSARRLGLTLQHLAKNQNAPLLFMVGLAVGAFGLLIPLFGFFWDDWPNAWFVHLFGPAGTLRAYTVDRPFMGVVYLFTTSWLGVEPGPWHLFALTTRILSALALWSLVKRIWPGESARNLAIALLFLIYLPTLMTTINGGGGRPYTDDVGEFLGTPMFWSHYDAATNLGLVRETGL